MIVGQEGEDRHFSHRLTLFRTVETNPSLPFIRPLIVLLTYVLFTIIMLLVKTKEGRKKRASLYASRVPCLLPCTTTLPVYQARPASHLSADLDGEVIRMDSNDSQ